MKAIIKVNKSSWFSIFNGLTFDVVDVLDRIVAVTIEGRTVDFSFKEIFIVDIVKELNTAKENSNDEKSKRLYKNLLAYKETNKLSF